MNAFSLAVRRLAQRAGYTLTRCQKHTGYPLDFTAEEVALIESVKPFTMTTPERMHALIHAVEYLQRHAVPGDFVECGVWRGGSMMVAAQTLLRLGARDRVLWLYDTFEGMTAPTEHDVSSKGVKATDKFARRQTGADRSDWCLADLEDVRRNVLGTGYPADRVRFVKGKVEETLSGEAPPQISLLRLDTDWYESTRYELEVLFPRLSVGGVLIIDDYGDWTGARKAVDEYLAGHGISFHLGRVDDSARLGLKLR
jgi:O-methyltransferase